MKRLSRQILSGTPGWMIAVGAVLIAFVLLRLRRVAYNVFSRWERAEGYEYEWIAAPLADGHGFAFENSRAWLGPYGSLDFSPTAWVEPVPTFLIAAAFFLFGEGGRFLLVLLNLLWILFATILVGLCLSRRRVAEGVLAALLFLAYQVETRPWLYIGNTALATFLFALIALLLFRTFERPTLGRTTALGAVIGLAHLVHAGSLIFGLAAVALIGFRCRHQEHGWRRALLLALVPFMLILPWTVRNFVTFDELVPVRTGFGWSLYMGNPALAMTLSPGSATLEPAPWSGSSPGEIVDMVRNVTNERSLRRHATELALTQTPADYSSMNEAQRDAYFGSIAARWIRDHPALAAHMSIEKVRAFLFGWSWPITVVTALAIAGLLFNIRDPRAIGLALLVAVYAIPYALAVPFYLRYRTPVDPFLFILIGLLVVEVNVRLERRRGRSTISDRFAAGAS